MRHHDAKWREFNRLHKPDHVLLYIGAFCLLVCCLVYIIFNYISFHFCTRET